MASALDLAGREEELGMGVIECHSDRGGLEERVRKWAGMKEE